MPQTVMFFTDISFIGGVYLLPCTLYLLPFTLPPTFLVKDLAFSVYKFGNLFHPGKQGEEAGILWLETSHHVGHPWCNIRSVNRGLWHLLRYTTT